MVKDVVCQSIRLTKNNQPRRDLSGLPYIGNDQVTVAEFRFIGVSDVWRVRNLVR